MLKNQLVSNGRTDFLVTIIELMRFKSRTLRIINSTCLKLTKRANCNGRTDGPTLINCRKALLVKKGHNSKYKKGKLYFKSETNRECCCKSAKRMFQSNWAVLMF